MRPVGLSNFVSCIGSPRRYATGPRCARRQEVFVTVGYPAPETVYNSLEKDERVYCAVIVFEVTGFGLAVSMAGLTEDITGE